MLQGAKQMTKKYVTAYIEKDSETNIFVGIVPGIPGAHTQADSIDELIVKLKEVLDLCLGEMDVKDREILPEFIGVQQIPVSL